MPLKEQSGKKQAVSGYYFSIASIKSSKESSNYNKIVCFAGVNDTGEAPEKSNIFANIRKKSKSLLGLSIRARRSCLKKKTRGEKSGGTVPLIPKYGNRFRLIHTGFRGFLSLKDSHARFLSTLFWHGLVDKVR
jgi:hypothetical protein